MAGIISIIGPLFSSSSSTTTSSVTTPVATTTSRAIATTTTTTPAATVTTPSNSGGIVVIGGTTLTLTTPTDASTSSRISSTSLVTTTSLTSSSTTASSSSAASSSRSEFQVHFSRDVLILPSACRRGGGRCHLGGREERKSARARWMVWNDTRRSRDHRSKEKLWEMVFRSVRGRPKRFAAGVEVCCAG